MKQSHVPVDELFALSDGELSGERARGVMDHVMHCAECQGYAAIALDVTDRTRELRADIDSAEPARSPSMGLVAAAIAAAVLVILGANLLMPPSRPASVAVTTVPAPPAAPAAHEWQPLVDEVVRGGRLQPPVSLLRLHREHDRLRGSAREGGVTTMTPAGAIVADTRPELSWSDAGGARYVVIVSDGANVVAESPLLRGTRWRCDVALARGRTYSWQLEVHRGGVVTMHPAPPDPPALFHVVDARTWAELERARRAVPGDPLLLGILYARAGLVDDARRALETARRGGRAEAAALLESLDDWP